MQREFKEKKEVEVSVDKTVCDACGTIVDQDNIFVRICATDSPRPYFDGNTLDICSSDCLAKNVQGIKLVLDSKVFPSTERSNNKKCADESEKCIPAMSAPTTPRIIIPLHIGK